MVGKLIEHKDYAYGYDAQTGEYGDLFKLGIIDPTKVVRTALQDAASVAGLLIMTEAMVAEKPKKETPHPRCRAEEWTTDRIGVEAPHLGERPVLRGAPESSTSCFSEEA